MVTQPERPLMFEIRIAGKENKDTTRVHRASWEEIEGEILRKRKKKRMEEAVYE